MKKAKPVPAFIHNDADKVARGGDEVFRFLVAVVFPEPGLIEALVHKFAKVGLGEGDDSTAHHLDGDGGEKLVEEFDGRCGRIAAAVAEPFIAEHTRRILVEVIPIVREPHI